MGWLEELRGELNDATRLRQVLQNAKNLPALEAELGFARNVDRLRRLQGIYETAKSAGQESQLGPLAEFLAGSPGSAERIRRAGSMPALEFLERFALVEARLHPLLASPEPAWVERVELALLHLNRSLVVDASLREAWAEAWKQREEALERLGAVHLLSHGLFGFKASASGSATDLILGSPLRTEESTITGSPLVLTEWKKASAADVESKTGSALRQLELYPAGVVATLALRRTRYAILVSERALLDTPPDKILPDGAHARIVNIIISPEDTSRQAQRTAG